MNASTSVGSQKEMASNAMPMISTKTRERDTVLPMDVAKLVSPGKAVFSGVLALTKGKA